MMTRKASEARDLEENTGFPIDLFVKTPRDREICSICLNVLNDPRQCSNGHLACVVCFKKNALEHQRCQLCKATITVSDTKNVILFAKQAIDELNVKCSCFLTNVTDGCGWTGELQDQRVRRCNFSRCECPNDGCREMIQIRHSDQHARECPKRLEICPHCENKFSFDILDLHGTSCEDRPIQCGCGLTVLFCDLPHHEEHDCPDKLVECPLFQEHVCCGECIGQIRRGDYDNHVGEPGLEVVQNMLKKIKSMRKTVVSQRKTLAENQGKLDAAEERIVDMETDMKNKQEQDDQASAVVNVISSASSDSPVKPNISGTKRTFEEDPTSTTNNLKPESFLDRFLTSMYNEEPVQHVAQEGGGEEGSVEDHTVLFEEEIPPSVMRKKARDSNVIHREETLIPHTEVKTYQRFNGFISSVTKLRAGFGRQETFDRTGSGVYEGNFLMDKKCGQGTMSYDNGDRYVGTFANNVPCGQGTMYFKNGRVAHGIWKHRNEVDGVLEYPRGGRYTGKVIAGKHSGYGTYLHSDGAVSKGVWKNDDLQGKGTFIRVDKTVLRGTWVNGEIIES